jgi:hypothetical protein
MMHRSYYLTTVCFISGTLLVNACSTDDEGDTFVNAGGSAGKGGNVNRGGSAGRTTVTGNAGTPTSGTSTAGSGGIGAGGVTANTATGGTEAAVTGGTASVTLSGGSTSMLTTASGGTSIGGNATSVNVAGTTSGPVLVGCGAPSTGGAIASGGNATASAGAGSSGLGGGLPSGGAAGSSQISAEAGMPATAGHAGVAGSLGFAGAEDGGTAGAAGSAESASMAGNAGAAGTSSVSCPSISNISCANTLTNAGTGDYAIAFTITTTDHQHAAVISQRSGCFHGLFWSIRMSSEGMLGLETDDNDVHYSVAYTTTPVNDGNPHQVVFQRVNGTVTGYVDCVPSTSVTGGAVLGALVDLRTGTDDCVGADGTAALDGTVTDICVGVPST